MRVSFTTSIIVFTKPLQHKNLRQTKVGSVVEYINRSRRQIISSHKKEDKAKIVAKYKVGDEIFDTKLEPKK